MVDTATAAGRGGVRARWGLRLGQPFELSYNFVAPAIRVVDGSRVVLKLSVPEPEQQRELEALVWFEGKGSVLVLNADREQGAMLLERLSPGAPLSVVENDEATAIAADVMASLWKPALPNHPFPTTKEWVAELRNLRQTFDGDTGPFPRRLVDRAERLFDELVTDDSPSVVLHGDLHHENVIAAERRAWLALDPKGVVGEPAYEVGTWLRNPMSRLLYAHRDRAT